MSTTEHPGNQAATGVTLVVRGARLTTPEGLSGPVDLLVAGDTIDDVVPASTVPVPAGAHVVEAAGRIAFPGFIDSHVHGEAAVLDPDVQLAMLRQGITSIVVGQDGVSYAPSAPLPVADGTPDAHTWATGYFSAINGEHPTFRGGPRHPARRSAACRAARGRRR